MARAEVGIKRAALALRPVVEAWLQDIDNSKKLIRVICAGHEHGPSKAKAMLGEYECGVLRVSPLTVLQVCSGGDVALLNLPPGCNPTAGGKVLKHLFSAGVDCRFRKKATSEAVRNALPQSFDGKVRCTRACELIHECGWSSTHAVVAALVGMIEGSMHDTASCATAHAWMRCGTTMPHAHSIQPTCLLTGRSSCAA